MRMHEPTDKLCYYCDKPLDSRHIVWGVSDDSISLCVSCAPRFLKDLQLAIEDLRQTIVDVASLDEMRKV
jgi:hypothetical protein